MLDKILTSAVFAQWSMSHQCTTQVLVGGTSRCDSTRLTDGLPRLLCQRPVCARASKINCMSPNMMSYDRFIPDDPRV